MEEEAAAEAERVRLEKEEADRKRQEEEDAAEEARLQKEREDAEAAE